jgi:solute carrier family 8 (sodium/calcium exchanger)
VITSKERQVTIKKPGTTDKYITINVRIWNETVSNLTLNALGAASPEILLNVVEVIGNNFEPRLFPTLLCNFKRLCMI